MKPYQYTYPKIPLPDLTSRGVDRVGSQEVLTGQVQGMKASDLEERMAGSFDKLNTGYIFRARLSAMIEGSRMISRSFRNLPGEIEIDLLLDSSQTIPVFIDGQISHFLTYWQREEDEVKKSIVDDFGEAMGWARSVRVPFVDILSQDNSDLVARRILQGTYTPTFIG